MANDVNNCWAKLDKTAGSGNETLHVYFDENNTGANRSVKIRAYDKTGEAVSEYTLVQLPKKATVYYNTEQTGSFQRTNCPSGYIGTYVEYTIPAGTYSSTVSVEDANRKAREALALEGPAYANVHGECNQNVWTNREMTKQYQKTGCDPDTEEGSMVDFTVEAGRFTSTVSQADADKKAEEYLDANGPAYANQHGECITVKWYNDAQSGRFQRTDCLSTETGSFVNYTVEAGRFSSTVSKEDANDKAKAALAIEGPEYANEHGICEESTWYNEEQRETFYKEDCPDGFVGAPYEYVVEAGKYSSTISQKDANNKALQEIEDNGQATANLEGECVEDPNYFIGKASARVQKNDCDPETQQGSWVNLTEKDLPGYPDAYVSHSSQPEADALAEAAMEEHKQALANEKGTCIDKDLFIGVYSEPFQRTNCADGGVGSTVVVTEADVQEYGPFESYESQEAANKLAEAAVKAHGEEIANAKGTCTWTGTASGEYCKTDCEEGQKGSCMTLTERDLTGYPNAFKSTESLDAANALAEAALAEQGPAIANNRGNCEDMTVYTGHAEETYTPDCGHCKEAPDMLVTAEMVNGSPVTSYISQPDADQKAQQILEEGGQNYANKNADCQPSDATPNWVDTDPLETECREGVSYKKQIDRNECSATYNTEQWVPGGDKTCSWVGTCESLPTQKDDCEDGKQGTIVEVTVEMCEGYPEDFTSFESQEAANTLACQLLAERAQSVANAEGSCNDCFPVVEKTWYKTDCPSCQEDLKGIFVSAEDVGGPFCAPDYDAETAQSTYNTLAQAYANKNIASCTPKPVEPDWQNVEPAEFECQEGKSMQKQQDMNECSGTYQEFRWVEGGDLTCQWTAPDSSQNFTRECADGGVGSEVTVQSSELEGYPFISYESPEDAEALRDAAFEAQGQEIANSRGTCTWTAEYSKSFTGNRTDCPSCQRGGHMSVSSTTLNGSPVTSNISYQDAYNKAQELVESQGQAYADKNAPCESYTESANWQDTGSTRCSGCTSEKQQRDNASCSSTAGTTRWISGGSRDCSENGTWSTGSWSSYECNGCTYQRHRTRSNSCGASETEWDRSYNYAGCGDWSDYVEDGCGSGIYDTYVRYTSTNSCSGEERYNYEQKDGKCGYSACDCTLTIGNSSVSIRADGANMATISLESHCGEGGYTQEVTVSSNQSWCDPRITSVGSSKRIMISCDANTSTSSRSATVTVRNACGASRTITVTQEGRDPVYVFECQNSPCEGNFDYEAANSSLGLLTSTKDGEPIGCSLTNNTGSSWCSVTGPVQSGIPTTYAFNLDVAQNNSSSTRSCTLTFTQNESGKIIQFPVTQSGKPSGECNLYVDESRTSATSGQFTLSLDISFSQTLGCWDDYNQYYLIMTVTGGTISSGYGRPTSTVTDTCSFNIQSGSSNEVANLSGKYAGGHHYYTVYIDLHSGFTSDSCHIAFIIQSTTGNCPCSLVHNYN